MYLFLVPQPIVLTFEHCLINWFYKKKNDEMFVEFEDIQIYAKLMYTACLAFSDPESLLPNILKKFIILND